MQTITGFKIGKETFKLNLHPLMFDEYTAKINNSYITQKKCLEQQLKNLKQDFREFKIWENQMTECLLYRKTKKILQKKQDKI